MMIARPALLKSVRDGLKANSVVALLGPRQCGKTTLARGLAGSVATSYFDLENPADLARLAEPMLALERVKGLAVIDEVQRRPDLFPVLRVLADRRPAPARGARRISPLLSGAVRGGKHALARRLHAYVPRAGPAATGHARARRDDAPLLDHARPLRGRHLERLGD